MSTATSCTPAERPPAKRDLDRHRLVEGPTGTCRGAELGEGELPALEHDGGLLVAPGAAVDRDGHAVDQGARKAAVVGVAHQELEPVRGVGEPHVLDDVSVEHGDSFRSCRRQGGGGWVGVARVARGEVRDPGAGDAHVDLSSRGTRPESTATPGAGTPCRFMQHMSKEAVCRDEAMTPTGVSQWRPEAGARRRRPRVQARPNTLSWTRRDAPITPASSIFSAATILSCLVARGCDRW